MDRRKFLNLIPRAAGASVAAGYLGGGLFSCGEAQGKPAGQPARYYKKRGGKAIQCQLCPWECIVSTNARGICGTRINRNGDYFTLAYGNPCSLNNDPIEKKPLYHFLPGTNALSEHISAYKVDLKSFKDKYYKEICDGKLQPVLDTLVRLKKYGTWSEIVYLVLPTLNDFDNTFCPQCGELLIRRKGYFATIKNLKKGACGKCGYKIAGVWE